MATHSSVLAWRIPGTGEPGGYLLWGRTESDTTEGLSSSSSEMYCCCLVAKSRWTLWDPMDWSPPGSSLHGTSQARILEWVVISFSRRSSLSSRAFTHWNIAQIPYIYLTMTWVSTWFPKCGKYDLGCLFWTLPNSNSISPKLRYLHHSPGVSAFSWDVSLLHQNCLPWCGLCPWLLWIV